MKSWRFERRGRTAILLDYDPEMDIYAHNVKTGVTRRLTTARDTTPREATPRRAVPRLHIDAQRLRRTLNDKEKKMLDENPSYSPRSTS